MIILNVLRYISCPLLLGMVLFYQIILCFVRSHDFFMVIMMRFLQLVVFLCAFMIPSLSMAETRYLGLNLGLTQTSDIAFSNPSNSGSMKFDSTMHFSAALGFNLSRHFRSEIELSYRSADLNEISFNGGVSSDIPGSYSTSAIMSNIYYDFRPGEMFNPYIMAGIGLANHKISLDAYNGLSAVANNTNALAYQLGAGLEAALTEEWSLTGGYRYFATTDHTIGRVDLDYGAHEFLVGLKYDFD